MTIVKTTALITINETLWVQMALFLIFLFIINRIMFRPVRRNMTEREGHFQALREDVRRLGAQLEALEAEMSAEERRMLEEARRMRREETMEGEREAQVLMDQARRDIDRLKAETEGGISAALAAERKRLATEQRALADAILEAVLERRAEG